jgi:hypothetical protein
MINHIYLKLFHCIFELSQTNLLVVTKNGKEEEIAI